ECAPDVGLSIAAKQNAMRQDARPFAGASERADDVQQVGVVALLGRRSSERLKSLMGIVKRVDAGAPAFVGKRRICDDVVEGLEGISYFVLGIRDRVSRFDECR